MRKWVIVIVNNLQNSQTFELTIRNGCMAYEVYDEDDENDDDNEISLSCKINVMHISYTLFAKTKWMHI